MIQQIGLIDKSWKRSQNWQEVKFPGAIAFYSWTPPPIAPPVAEVHESNLYRRSWCIMVFQVWLQAVHILPETCRARWNDLSLHLEAVRSMRSILFNDLAYSWCLSTHGKAFNPANVFASVKEEKRSFWGGVQFPLSAFPKGSLRELGDPPEQDKKQGTAGRRVNRQICLPPLC